MKKMERICSRSQEDGTVCDGEMICYVHTQSSHEDTYTCNKCGRQASGITLIIEAAMKRLAGRSGR